MCLAVPGKIISLKGNTAKVDFNGVEKEVSVDLVPKAQEDNYVLVHAGFAIEILEKEQALETLKVFNEIYGKDKNFR